MARYKDKKKGNGKLFEEILERIIGKIWSITGSSLAIITYSSTSEFYTARPDLAC